MQGTKHFASLVWIGQSQYWNVKGDTLSRIVIGQFKECEPGISNLDQMVLVRGGEVLDAIYQASGGFIGRFLSAEFPQIQFRWQSVGRRLYETLFAA